MKFCSAVLLILITSSVSVGAQTVPEDQKILERSDVRFYPKEGSWNLRIKTENTDGQKLEFTFDLYIKGYQNQTAVWSSPATSRGDVAMKMNRVIYHKQSQWPKPQIMSYQAVFVDSAFSFGDVLNANLADDYTVTQKRAVVEQEKECWLLTLTPKAEGLYAKIEVTVDKANFNTLRRTYFTASGEKEKESVFSSFSENAGKVSGFTVTMKNLFLDLNSVAVVDQIKAGKIPAFLFDPQALGRIHAK